jgi:hypothetical protein
MLKKIVDKRIELFKQEFPDFQVSKKSDSLYTRIGLYENKKSVVYTGRAVTKGNISKLGKIVNWTETKARYVYLLTPKGRLMVSKNGGNFRSVTLKTIREECTGLQSLFFVGKKYEWMKEYPCLWEYKFFQSFNSLSEAKKFLDFSFISDADFIKLFGLDRFDYLQPIILAKDKKNILRLYKNLDTESSDLLTDYINMCHENDIEIEIPAGVNKLKELHDSAMWEVNKKKAECYSKEYRYDIIENFTKSWAERGLVFRRLSTPYEMYLQGVKQQHCIGTNYATTLHSYAFYTFYFDNKEYDIQLYKNGSVGQFYGRKNRNTPQELRDRVKEDISLKFDLVDTKPNLENYPLIGESTEIRTRAEEDEWYAF